MYNNPYNFYPYMNGFNQAGMFESGVRGASALAPNFGSSLGSLGGAATGARIARPSLFQAIRNIKWSSILTNTQKTLNVINQAIPVYYQIKPIANNLRSFGKIMNAFNSPDEKAPQVARTQEVNQVEPEKKETTDGPTFFIN